MRGAAIFCLGLSLAFPRVSPGANCDLAELQQAVRAGGTYTLNCDTFITVTNTFVITNSMVIDASRHSVTLDGGGTGRLFDIRPGGSLTLSNIVLQNGFYEGVTPPYSSNSVSSYIPAENGEGGAVRNAGAFHAVHCSFRGNLARGGKGAFNAVLTGIGTGGAIFSSGDLRLDDCEVSGSSAQGGGSVPGPFLDIAGGTDGRGGGIYIAGGNATLNRTRILNNAAVASRSVDSGANGLGGGLYVADGMVELTDCEVSGNLGDGGYGRWEQSSGFGEGGGIYAAGGRIEIAQTSIRENRVRSAMDNFHEAGGVRTARPAKGGGLSVKDGATVTIDRSTISGNVATASDSGFQPIPELPGLYIYLNASGFGGGIWNEGHVTLLNSTLAANVARCADAEVTNLAVVPSRGSAQGAAIYAAGPNSLTEISFCTIAGNAAVRPNDPGTNDTAHAGGIFRTNGVVTISNSVLADNTPENVFGTVTDGGHNLVTDSSLQPASPTTIQATDAKLAPFGLYEGVTETMPLLPGSPAIDRAECLVAVDERGQNRPSGAGCDIGAFEAGSTNHYLVVTFSTTPSAPLTVTAESTSLNSSNKTVVLGRFAPGHYNILVDGPGALGPSQAIEIIATSPEVVLVAVAIQADVRPQISLAAGDKALIRFPSTSGGQYRVQQSASVTDPAWTTVQEVVGTGDGVEVALGTAEKEQFFRVVRLSP